jgi:CDP-glycerol glycerophosphotransferase
LIRQIEFVKKHLILLIIHIFNCLPIKKNKIFLFSYYGSQYGCSPKYITEYILKQNYPKDKFDLVWAFNDPSLRKNMAGIRIVKTMSLRYFYELCTSKIVITNFRTTDLFIKRKNQYYIQTWHSSLRLKQIEKDAEESLPNHYVEMAKKDSLKCDLLLSGCEYSTKIFERSFWYEGEIFEHGTPRNDLLFQTSSLMIKRIRDKLNIPVDHKIVLYAPTFRKNNSLEVYDLNYQEILLSLRSRFGDNWIFIVKLHPHLLLQSKNLSFADNVIDANAYDDIQELLSISDVLISDYSSLMFDFSITQRPCFLYVPDIFEYINQDRKLYFDMRELPFISSTNNQDLLNKIENFHYEEYKSNLIEFLKSIGTYEEGKSCENLLKQINEVCFITKGRIVNEAV